MVRTGDHAELRVSRQIAPCPIVVSMKQIEERQ